MISGCNIFLELFNFFLRKSLFPFELNIKVIGKFILKNVLESTVSAMHLVRNKRWTLFIINKVDLNYIFAWLLEPKPEPVFPFVVPDIKSLFSNAVFKDSFSILLLFFIILDSKSLKLIHSLFTLAIILSIIFWTLP